MIRVMHILTDTNVGGAGRLLLTLLRHTDQASFTVTAVLPAGGAMVAPLREAGIRVLETDGGRDRSFAAADVRELCRLIRRERPDVVHTHASLSGRIAATLCRVPGRVYTRHCTFPSAGPLTRFPGRQLCGLLTRVLSTDIIAVAEAAADDLTAMGIPRKRITVIPNGTDPLRDVPEAEVQALRQALGIPPEAFVCGISARMEPCKGHAELLEAAASVLRVRPDIRFLLLGTGSEEARLRKMAADTGIAGQVIFVGLQRDVAPYYRLMNLHLNNSYGTETASLSILEAKSIALPTLATAYGGTPRQIRNGEDGVLIPVHAPARLAEEILRLAGDPAELARLGQNALRAFAERGRAETMTRRTEDVWRRRVSHP